MKYLSLPQLSSFLPPSFPFYLIPFCLIKGSGKNYHFLSSGKYHKNVSVWIAKYLFPSMHLFSNHQFLLFFSFQHLNLEYEPQGSVLESL